MENTKINEIEIMFPSTRRKGLSVKFCQSVNPELSGQQSSRLTVKGTFISPLWDMG